MVWIKTKTARVKMKEVVLYQEIGYTAAIAMMVDDKYVGFSRSLIIDDELGIVGFIHPRIDKAVICKVA